MTTLSERWVREIAGLAFVAGALGASAQQGADPSVPLPRSPGALLARGQDLLRNGRLEEAERAFEEAVSLEPRNVLAWNSLGQARYASKRFEPALQSFEKARSLAPQESKLHANVGICLFEIQRYAAAVAALSEALRIEPSYGKARLFLGRIAAERGDLAGAEKELRLAGSQSPEEPLTHYYLGLLLFKQRRYTEAVPAFEKALKVSPDLASAHLNLGHALLRLGEEERGERHLDRFRALTEATLADQELSLRVTTRLKAARLEIEAGRAETALRLALQARDLAPRVPAVHALLAEIYARQGRKEESEREREEFRRLSATGNPR